MNWLQKLAQPTWGRERLSEMIGFAFQAQGGDHPAGEFKPRNPALIPNDDYLLFDSPTHHLRLYLTPEEMSSEPGWPILDDEDPVSMRSQSMISVNMTIIKRNYTKSIGHWVDFADTDIHAMPQDLVVITYKLIDKMESGDGGSDNDDSPTHDPTPDPADYVDSPSWSPNEPVLV